MTVYITGDTHSQVNDRFSYSQNPWAKQLTIDDYMIIAGDFGVVWDRNSKNDAYWLNFMNEKPWKTIVILGNHENYDLYDEMPNIIIPELCEGTVKACVYMDKTYDNIIIVDNLAVLNLEGDKYLCIAGAESHDKEWRIEGLSWWPQEEINVDTVLDFIEEHSGEYFDYIITHEAPQGINDWYMNGFRANDCAGQKLLGIVKNNIQFGKWFHGHMHFDSAWPLSNTIFGIYKGVYEITTGKCLNDSSINDLTYNEPQSIFEYS